MSLYDRKTDRINKTRARVTKKGSKRSAAAVNSSDDFALHSALDTVEFADDVDADESSLPNKRRAVGSDDSPSSVDTNHAEDQVAECEDEIDRVKRRHEAEMSKLAAEVSKRCGRVHSARDNWQEA